MTTHLYSPGRLRITPHSAAALDDHVLPLGFTDTGLAAVNLDEDRHVLVTGPASSGKATVARALAAYLLAQGWGAIITGRRVRRDYGNLAGWANAHVRETEEAEAEDLRTLVQAEVMRRFEIMRAVRAEHRDLIGYEPRRYFWPLVLVEDGDLPFSAECLAYYCGSAAVHIVQVVQADQIKERGDCHRFFTTWIVTARPGRTISEQTWGQLFPRQVSPPVRTGPHVSIAGEAAAPRPLESSYCDHVDLELCAAAGAALAVTQDEHRSMQLAEVLGTRPGAVGPAPAWLLRGGDL
ncbi:hypothetical protein [Pseudonocardia sp. ICBG1142]|uniref:hypothetical protein n=1 Tax=Pseudonocardia sp. ICBG1142 TaxID=2846760 RepID=UPI001CF66E9A|nr:hypothetical protein [Pseudonocardia sp. ICBG1142]